MFGLLGNFPVGLFVDLRDNYAFVWVVGLLPITWEIILIARHSGVAGKNDATQTHNNRGGAARRRLLVWCVGHISVVR